MSSGDNDTTWCLAVMLPRFDQAVRKSAIVIQGTQKTQLDALDTPKRHIRYPVSSLVRAMRKNPDTHQSNNSTSPRRKPVTLDTKR